MRGFLVGDLRHRGIFDEVDVEPISRVLDLKWEQGRIKF